MISCPEPKLIRSQKTCGGRESVGGGGDGEEGQGRGGGWDNWGQGAEVAARRKMRTDKLGDRDRQMKKEERRRRWRRVKRS